MAVAGAYRQDWSDRTNRPRGERTQGQGKEVRAMTQMMLRDPLFADFRLVDDLFGRVFGNGNRVTGFVPALDLRETEDEYLVLVDIPGVKPEDVVVELND